jgi:hypothetical protein
MSTRPLDSVFGVPDSPGRHTRTQAVVDTYAGAQISSITDHQSPEAAVDDPRTPGSDVEWSNAELHSIASTIEELQQRLVDANSRLSTASQVETTEFEIGRLFVEAQRFSEESLSNLEQQINDILNAAEAKAVQILDEATEEALEIRRQAQAAAVESTKTARELQVAIVGFTTINNELVKELGALNSMLSPGSEPGNDGRTSGSTSPDGL